MVWRRGVSTWMRGIHTSLRDCVVFYALRRILKQNVNNAIKMVLKKGELAVWRRVSIFQMTYLKLLTYNMSALNDGAVLFNVEDIWTR